MAGHIVAGRFYMEEIKMNIMINFKDGKKAIVAHATDITFSCKYVYIDHAFNPITCNCDVSAYNRDDIDRITITNAEE